MFGELILSFLGEIGQKVVPVYFDAKIIVQTNMEYLLLHV